MDDAIVFLWQTNVSNGGLSLSIGRLKWCFSDASVYGSGNYGFFGVWNLKRYLLIYGNGIEG